jgi:hypothetical protein
MVTSYTWFPLRLLFLSVILWLVSGPDLNGQPILPPQATLERQLTYAENHLHRYNYRDSVLALTGRILKGLEVRHQADSPFGLRVQLVQASAFEKSLQDSLALIRLLRIEQLSRKKQLWEVYARACIVRSLIYEKTSFGPESRQELDQAKMAIDRYKLDSVYPRFANRMASWQRWFSSKDSALFFAREAIRTAPRYNLLREEAEGYMLLGYLFTNVNDAKAIEATLKAKNLYIKEIDVRYQTQLKKQQLDEQALALRLKNNQLIFLVSIGLLVLVLAFGLALSYRRQRQTARQLTTQNALIRQQAEQLKSLDAANPPAFLAVFKKKGQPVDRSLLPIAGKIRLMDNWRFFMPVLLVSLP